MAKRSDKSRSNSAKIEQEINSLIFNATCNYKNEQYYTANRQFVEAYKKSINVELSDYTKWKLYYNLGASYAKLNNFSEAVPIIISALNIFQSNDKVNTTHNLESINLLIQIGKKLNNVQILIDCYKYKINILCKYTRYCEEQKSTQDPNATILHNEFSQEINLNNLYILNQSALVIELSENNSSIKVDETTITIMIEKWNSVKLQLNNELHNAKQQIFNENFVEAKECYCKLENKLKFIPIEYLEKYSDHHAPIGAKDFINEMHEVYQDLQVLEEIRNFVNSLIFQEELEHQNRHDNEALFDLFGDNAYFPEYA